MVAMKTAGIDPGQTGAIAFIEEGKVVALYDMPTMARMHGKGQEVNGSELASILMEHRPDSVNVELVASMPKQGVSSTFRFGESYGVVKGILQALQIPYRGVTPQRWKGQAGLIGKEKDAARALAIQLHPEISDQLTRKKDTGRADAIHIARYA